MKEFALAMMMAVSNGLVVHLFDAPQWAAFMTFAIVFAVVYGQFQLYDRLR